MKKLLLVALIGIGAWWYFIGGAKLTEAQVNEFYRDVEIATLERKPENLCALLADNFQSTGSVAVGGEEHSLTQDKTQTCNNYRQMYAGFDKLGEKMGGMLQLDSSYQIHSITISPDGKNATVDISTALDVAGSIMNLRARSTDTLVRKNGKVRFLRSEGNGAVDGGS